MILCSEYYLDVVFLLTRSVSRHGDALTKVV